MLINAICSIHTHHSAEQRHAGLARRAEWKYPAGVKVVHEVWRAQAPEVIITMECDSYEPIMAMQLAWADFFQMSFAPATTPEAGLAAGAKMMKR